MKKLKIFLLSLFLISLFSIPSFAIVYPTQFPAYVPVSGGAYIEVQSTAIGRGTLIFSPVTIENTFGFSGTGNNICNLSSGTVTGTFYATNGTTTYTVRMVRLGTLEYQTSTSSTWNSVTISQIYNTNVFFTDETTRNRQTDGFRTSSSDRLTVVIGTIIVLLILVLIYFSGRRKK